jgi:ribosome maturation factor RimP
MTREAIISKITALAEQAAAPAGIEIVEVELKGSGHSHLLRIYIDRPEGVTHTECELVSRELSAALDMEDPIPGHYELEVSSPGVERKLAKWKDWERFRGKQVKVVLKEPIVLEKAVGEASANGPSAELKHFDGVIARAADQQVTVELGNGREVSFPVDQVDRANLKFDW